MNVPFVWRLLLVVAKIVYLTNANWITGNLCWSMPCLNGGSCFGSAYTYLCVCPVNYSGALCEKRLGICQESPCGNRGLCVETGLFSFECRCYFDYMGPLCEEHIPKNDPSVWSSLIPVHTRVLFDILQEAYRVKANDKSGLDSNNGQSDAPTLMSTNDPSSSSPTSVSTTQLESDSSLRQSETTEAAHIIRAEGIRLENIFPPISTSTISNVYTPSFTTEAFSTLETTQEDYFNDETTAPRSTTFEMTTQTTENIPTTEENMVTVSREQNQTTYFSHKEDQQSFHITEQDTTIISSTSGEWLSSNSNNHTADYTTEITPSSTVQSSNHTDSVENTTQTMTNTSPKTTNSYRTDDRLFHSSEAPMISSAIPTDPSFTTAKSTVPVDISQSVQHQLLLKLCQQLLSQILPNVTSLSASAAVEAALSLSSGSPSFGNSSAEALLTWIKEQLDSTTRSPSTTSTTTTLPTTTTTTTTTTTLSSSVPSLSIQEKKSSLISLQRVDMDDVLHQMNNHPDSET